MLLNSFSKLFASTMKVRSHCANGKPQRVRDLLVAAFFLMIKDQYRPLNLTEELKLLLHCLLKLPFFEPFLGVAVGMCQPILPCGGLVRKRHVGAIIAPAALPLVLRYIDRDPVEVGSYQSLATKTRQRSVEPQKDVLGKIIDVLTASGQAQQGTEDHRLMVAYQLLEGEIDVQARLDHRVLRKFHSRE